MIIGSRIQVGDMSWGLDKSSLGVILSLVRAVFCRPVFATPVRGGHFPQQAIVPDGT
jgi:hypothetical protein